MNFRLVFVRKDARAFHHNVDTQFLPRQLGGIFLRQHLDWLAVSDVHRVAFDTHSTGVTAMNTVKLEQVGVVFSRAEIIDGDDFDVCTLRLSHGA